MSWVEKGPLLTCEPIWTDSQRWDPLLQMLRPLSTMVKGKEVVGPANELLRYFQSKGGS